LWQILHSKFVDDDDAAADADVVAVVVAVDDEQVENSYGNLPSLQEMSQKD